MSKGVLGIGCSYTWGEGLYFYSNLEGLPFSENHYFNHRTVTPAMEAFKDKHKFISLIADYYNTWGFTNPGNGGDHKTLLDWGSQLIEKYNRFKKTDFDLLIFQFTARERDFLKFDLSIENIIEQVNHLLLDYENLGIKVVSISWDPEIPEHDLYEKYFKHRHVDIHLGSRTFKSFYNLTKDLEVDGDPLQNNESYNFTISSDFEKYGFQKNDEHFNLHGHRVVADSIIKKLDEDNFKIKHKIDLKPKMI